MKKRKRRKQGFERERKGKNTRVVKKEKRKVMCLSKVYDEE